MKKFLIILILVSSYIGLNAQNLKLVTNYQGKYGYINDRGDTIIPCKYDKATEFIDGIALVKTDVKHKLIDKNGKLLELSEFEFSEKIRFDYQSWGDALPLIIDVWKCSYIDEKGNVALSIPYRDATEFYEGEANVYEGDKYNTINKKGELTGEWKPIYDDAFSVFNGEKYALADANGNLLSDFIYTESLYFYNELSCVSKIDKNFITKYGFINNKGEVVIDYQYDASSYFYSDYAPVLKNGKYFLIDKTNKKLTDEYDNLTYVTDSLYIAEKENKFALINIKNEVLTEWYERLENKYENMLAFYKDGFYGLMDIEGNIILENKYLSIYEFYGNFSYIGNDNDNDGYSDTYAVINKKGELLTDFKYNSVSASYYSDYIKVGIEKEEEDAYYVSYLYGYIDTTGNEIVDCIYDYLYEYVNDHAIVGIYSTDDYSYLYGMIDKKGKEVVDVEYSYLNNGSEGLISAYKDYKYGYIDITGKVIIDFQYDYAYDFSEGKALVGTYNTETYEYSYFYIDKKNNRLTDINCSNGNSFNEGTSLIYSYDYSDYNYESYYYDYTYKYNILNYKCELLVPDTFTYCNYFDTRHIIKVGKEIDSNDVYSFLDKNGKLLIPYLPQIAYFDEYPIIKKGDYYSYEYALANKKGEKISDYFSVIYKFKNGFAKVKNAENQYSLINSEGEKIIDFYENVDNFENGKAKIYKDNKVAFIDENGKIISDFAFDVVNQTTNFKIIKYNDKYALLNLSDEIMGNFYDTIEIYNNNIAILLRFGQKTIYNTVDESFTCLTYLSDSKDAVKPAASYAKYGLIDDNFNWILEPKYDSISDFENGKALVINECKTNYIDKTGKLLNTEWSWDKSVEFITVAGLSFIKYDNKYALVDENKNKISDWYYYLTEHNGNAIVKQGYYYYNFEDNMPVEYYGYYSDLSSSGNYTDNGYKYGFVDTGGNIVVDYQFDYTYSFSEGIAVAENYGDYYNYSYFLINEKGEIINSESFDYAGTCSEGLIPVQRDGKYGYIDKDGNTVIDFKYTYAYSFNNGLAKVENDYYQYGFIDREGNMIIDFSNNSVGDFYGEYAIQNRYYMDNYYYSLINRKGQISSEWFNNLTYISDSVYLAKKIENNKFKSALIKTNGELLSKWFDFIIYDSYSSELTVISDKQIDFIDSEGNFVNDSLRNELIIQKYYFYDGIATIYITDDNYSYQYGFIDEQGNVIVEPQFDYVYNFKNNYAIVEDYGDYYNYTYALVNKKGEIVTEWYAAVSDFGGNLFKIKKNEKYCVLNNNLEQICDWTNSIINANDNSFFIRNESKFLLLDSIGNEVTDEEIYSENLKQYFLFNEDYATFSEYNDVDYTSKYGVINLQGNIVINPEYEYLGNLKNGLIVFSEDDENSVSKYGYMNINEEVIIEPQFETAYDFSEEMAKVSKYNSENYETNYGYINKSGELVIDYQFYSAEDFLNGYGIVQKKFDYNIMTTFVDKQGNVFQNWYELVLPFDGDYAPALKYDKFVLLDNKGNEVVNETLIKQKLADNYDYKDGIAKVTKNSLSYGEPCTTIINENGKTLSEWYVSIGDFSDEGLAVVELDLDYNYYTEYGYINKLGKLVIDIQYNYAEPFKNGTAIVGVPGSGYYNNYGIINTEGDYILDPIYESLRNFSEDRAVVAQYTDDYLYKYGMIDKNGKLVVDYKYDYIGDLHSGLAVVYEYDAYNYTNTYGYINKKGKQVIDYKYKWAGDFNEDLAIVCEDNNEDYINEYGFINKKGKQVIDCEYENATNFVGGYAIVSKTFDNVYKSAFIDKTGKIVSEWFDLLYGFYNSYALTYKDGKFVLLDENFNFVDNNELLKDYLSNQFYFSEGFAIVQMNKKYGFINKEGEVVIDFKFDYADNFYGGQAYVEIDYQYYYVYPDGTLEPYTYYYDDYSW